eukprot:359821-Chlamydomonas_euryale.AAC.2
MSHCCVTLHAECTQDVQLHPAWAPERAGEGGCISVAAHDRWVALPSHGCGVWSILSGWPYRVPARICDREPRQAKHVRTPCKLLAPCRKLLLTYAMHMA